VQHSIRLEGEAFALRPVELADAAFIAELRSDPERARYLHPTPPGVAAQEDYLRSYFSRPDDYYFVVERMSDRACEGLVSIYNIDTESRRGEWGRWLIKSGSPAAVESALLIYRVAFEILELHEVYSLTIAVNEPVVSFHDSCGCRRERTFESHFPFEDQPFDAIEHTVNCNLWLEIKPALSAQAKRIARMVNRAQTVQR
jgi:RimJ/RimL family protein N-acetyltransferase